MIAYFDVENQVYAIFCNNSLGDKMKMNKFDTFIHRGSGR